MKKFITLAIAIMFSFSLFAQGSKGVIWETGSFNEVLAKAKKSKGKKLVFMDCYTSWCGPCKRMANEVFPTEEAGKYFNAKFINAKFDMEKGEGKDLLKRYKVAAFPTFLILDADGNEIGRVVGGGKLNEFIALVEKAMDVNNSPKKIKEKYDADKTVDNAVMYFKALSDAYMKNESKAFAEEVINNFKPSELFSETLWTYLKQNVGNSEKIHQYLVDHKDIAASKIGSENVNALLLQLYINKLYFYLTGDAVYGKIKKEEVTDDVVKSCISIVRLIAPSDDCFSTTIAKLAELRMEGKAEDIAKMYNYHNFAGENEVQIDSIEMLFIKLKEIGKENIEEYYKQKVEFYEDAIKNSNSWKDFFVQSKEKQNK